MWKCHYCGRDNAASMVFCGNCGTKRREGSTSTLMVCILAGLMLLGAALLLVYFTVGAGADEIYEAEAMPNITALPAVQDEEKVEPSEEGQTPKEEETFPTFSLPALNGGMIDESYFSEHKLVMVNFWATWCGPCVGEMPDLQRLADKYADYGFALLGVLVFDDDVEGAKEFLNDSGICYPTIEAKDIFAEMSEEYDAIPTTIFFDQFGNQVGEIQVGSMNLEAWSRLVEEYLKEVS